MYHLEQNAECTPDSEQKIRLLRVAINKTIEIICGDLEELRAILLHLECEIEEQDLDLEQRLKRCPHCCLVEEEKRKSNHLAYLEECLKICK